MACAPTDVELAEVISDELKALASRRGQVKRLIGRIALDLKRADSTIENWYRGTNAPDGAGVLGLIGWLMDEGERTTANRIAGLVGVQVAHVIAESETLNVAAELRELARVLDEREKEEAAA